MIFKKDKCKASNHASHHLLSMLMNSFYNEIAFDDFLMMISQSFSILVVLICLYTVDLIILINTRGQE